MLTRTDIEGLDQGDTVEHWALYPGVTSEPLHLEVLAKVTLEGSTMVAFKATYFGVKAGVLHARSEPGKPDLTWELDPS